MFGKGKGPTKKAHEEHAAEAYRNFQQAKIHGDSYSTANVHALFAIYTLLNERLPVREQGEA